MTVLAITADDDLHYRAVARELYRLNMPVAVWEAGRLLDCQGQLLTFASRRERSGCQIQMPNNSVIDLEQVSAIWLRRAGRVHAPRQTEAWVRQVVENETTKALTGILSTLPVFWVNHPLNQQEALLKLRQLDLARQAGFVIPRTLVTNDPAAVEDFYDSCGGKVVYKLIDEESQLYLPYFEIPCGIPTLALLPAEMQHKGQVAGCLHLFQEKIDKTCDLRVTVVGNKIFAVRIDSQEGSGQIDWRLDYSVPMSVYTLDEKTAASCLSLMKLLGLQYAAFDLCLTTAGETLFFETNPQGQYLWQEQRLGMPISRQLAGLLAGGGYND